MHSFLEQLKSFYLTSVLSAFAGVKPEWSLTFSSLITEPSIRYSSLLLPGAERELMRSKLPMIDFHQWAYEYDMQVKAFVSLVESGIDEGAFGFKEGLFVPLAKASLKRHFGEEVVRHALEKTRRFFDALSTDELADVFEAHWSRKKREGLESVSGFKLQNHCGDEFVDYWCETQSLNGDNEDTRRAIMITFLTTDLTLDTGTFEPLASDLNLTVKKPVNKEIKMPDGDVVRYQLYNQYAPDWWEIAEQLKASDD